MKRVTLQLSDADVSALNDLLETTSPDEARALLERAPRYTEPGFFRRIVGWSRANPTSGGHQIPFYVRHMHETVHRALASQAGSPLKPADPHAWNVPALFATLASLETLPADPGTTRLPDDIKALLGDIEGAGVSSQQPLPAHEAVSGQSWSLIVARCFGCDRRQAIAKPHFVDLRSNPAAADLVRAGATENRCRDCGFGVLEPQFVWVQEQPGTGDGLGALSCLIATDSVVVYQPPAWGYRMDVHGVLLEERSSDLINVVKPGNLSAPVHSFRIVYTPEELRSAVSGEPDDPFFLAAAAVTVRLEEAHVTLRDAEEMARTLAAAMDLTEPTMGAPVDQRTWFPLACALLSEAIVERHGFSIPDRVVVTLHTAACLTAVRKLDAALVAIARAAKMVSELPSDDPQRVGLSDLVRAARGDVSARQQGQPIDARDRLKLLLEADPTGSPLEQSAYWTGRALLALHAKKDEQYAESLRLFCEAIPELARLVSTRSPDPQGESLVYSFSAALANVAGTLLELSCDATCAREHVVASAALVEALDGKRPDLEGKTLEESLLELAEQLVLRALHYSLSWCHFEHIALQSERLSDVLIRLKKYDQVESLIVAAVGAALQADSNECAARNALRLAHHSVRTGHVANVLNMAETAALAAARFSIESGTLDAGVPYGTEACFLALQVANLADVESRKRIILVIENQKALLTGNALQLPTLRSPPKVDPALARRREKLRAELILLEDHEAEAAEVKLDLESTVAQIAREVADYEASSEWHAHLADSRPVTSLTTQEAADLLSRLGPRTTLLGMFEHGDRAWVYALWPEGAEIVEVDSWISFEEELETFVESVASSRVSDELTKSISSVLLRPLGARLPELRPKDRVVISPFGQFAIVPFDALQSGNEHLCELTTLSITLGLGTLAGCLDRPKTSADRLLAVGDPTRTTPRSPLNSRDEVLCLESLYIAAGRVAKRLLGADATPERVAELMPTSNVVHFACHASAKDAILPSRLLLAETPTRGESGVVTGEDVCRSYTLVDGGLVVLAACESGQMSLTVGHDADALVPAFHRAGASSIVAARWVVRDLPTRLFVEHLHATLLKGQLPASALATTVRACLHGELGELLKAPSMWGAFALYGR